MSLFIVLIAPRDYRPNLYVRQANVYVRQYGEFIIQSVKKQISVSVIILLVNYTSLSRASSVISIGEAALS